MTGLFDAIFGRAQPPPEPRRNAAQRGARPRAMRTADERAVDADPGVRRQGQRERLATADAARYGAGVVGPGGVTGTTPRSRVIEESNGALRDRADDAPQRPLHLGRPARTGLEPRVSAAPNSATSTMPVGPGGVGASEQPIDMAARVTNTPAPYLRAIAGQEGGNDDRAKNPNSTATGIAQFIGPTWMRIMNTHGAQYGLPRGMSRAEVLELRNNPRWAMLMAGHLYTEEATTMSRITGRPVRVDEVYLGHFLGGDVAGGMIRMMERGESRVSARAAIHRLNPSGAAAIIRANRRQFAPGMTVASLYAMQTQDFVEHGVRNGGSRAELTALAITPRRGGTHSNDAKPRNGSKQGTLIGSRAIANTERDRANAERDAESSAEPVDRMTGLRVLPTAEERREQRRIEEEAAGRAERRSRGSVTLSRGRIGYRVPF